MIKFGTDGWRGIIADDFTFDNVRRVAGGIAAYVLRHEDPARGVFIGYDTRFLSQQAARVAAEIIAEAGIPVQPYQGFRSDSGGFACGKKPGRRRRSDGHLQSQSVELEWREVQSKVWRIGHARHHEGD